MINLLKLKKRNVVIFLLISNQLILHGYSLNNRKSVLIEVNKISTLKKNNKELGRLNLKKYKEVSNYISHELIRENTLKKPSLIQKDIVDLELEKLNFKVKVANNNENNNFEKTQYKSIHENIKNNNITNTEEKDNFKSELKTFDNNENAYSDKQENESIFDDLKKNSLISEEEKNDGKSLLKKINIKDNTNNKKDINKLPLPSKSEISSSEFNVPSRGYLKLKGPAISLNLERADVFETLKLLGKLGNYGIVIIEENQEKDEEPLNNPKITASFDEVNISDVFNSILLSSNMQAIVENNIIFVGKNILNKSLKSKVSKTYRLNQVNAASVADYLSTLGARISKVMVISGSIDGQEVNDSLVNKKEFQDEFVNPYGMEGGPLFGLIGTADLRLQTINLIGTKELLNTAEKYIKSLDVRHRQVALTIKIIDVALTKNDIKNNTLELVKGSTTFIGAGGLAVITSNTNNLYTPLAGSPVVSENQGAPLQNNEFFNWISAKITNEDAKVLASPTLILGENPNILSSGAAQIDDSLNTATIGRPFKNEGFIKVGETVFTGFTQTQNEGGSTTCTATEGTAGITFGAKVDKIDDNGYVSFALSPAISSVTRTAEISGCGIQSTLSVRKLDTGSIRVKNGDTLILTGVLQDADNVTTSKVPILGDLPILGFLFRQNTTTKRKSELIILVTPKILKDE